MAAKNHHKKTLIGIIKSNWFPLKEVITIELFEIFMENQDILNIDDIYNALLLIVQQDLNKKQKNDIIRLISQIRSKENEKMPFLLETYINLIKYNLDMIKLHFKYSLDGVGYDDAKKDFISKLKK